MRSVKRAASFKKDIKREAGGVYKSLLAGELLDIVDMLANDTPLPAQYDDHNLSGNWKHHRECHVRTDFLLIYRKIAADMLALVRLGSHSELYRK